MIELRVRLEISGRTLLEDDTCTIDDDKRSREQSIDCDNSNPTALPAVV